MKRTAFITLFMLSSGHYACKRAEDLDNIDRKLASPTDIVMSKDGSHAFVLNADVDKRFKTGSILAIDTNKNKVGAITTPRLGRFMVRRGDILIAGFNKPDQEEEQARIVLYDISDPTNISQLKEFFIDCDPMTAAVADDYRYFALQCFSRELFIGEIKDPVADSTLKHVRTYVFPRRAMHLDKTRGLLYMFATDIGTQFYEDLIDTDTLSVSDTGAVTEAPNEVPDSFERRSDGSRLAKSGEEYKMIVYDIDGAAAADEPFPYIDRSSLSDEEKVTFKNEHRWVYFTLFDLDGTPDSTAGVLDPNQKYYRTNFYKAVTDPDDESSFYLSQRSKKGNFYNFSNNVIKLSIVGDPRVRDGVVPKISDFALIEREFGFRAEQREDGRDFPNDFDVLYIKGRKTLILNHFKDLSSFSRPEQSYRLVAKLLDGSQWMDDLSSQQAESGMYNVAANSDGIGFSCLFYTHQLIRFEVNPGNDITSGPEENIFDVFE